MQDWAKEWLETQRKEGKKCLELKEIQGKIYVYHSTTVYDKAEKKPKKVSKYLGKLTLEDGLVPKKDTTRVVSPPRSVGEYGNACLLVEEFHPLLPALQAAFPDSWQEIIALIFTRVCDYVPLIRIRDAWEKYANVLNIQPTTDPRHLSDILKQIGSDATGQNEIFQALHADNSQLAYDLSFLFSHSDNLNLAEFGHNAEEIWLPQINIALFTDVNTHLPVMLRTLPGSVKDVATLSTSLALMKSKNTTLVLDRGFVSEKNEQLLAESGIDFVLPQRRNSKRYETRIHLRDHFFYHDRLIHGGKREEGKMMLYLFEDVNLRAEEEITLYRRQQKGDITQEKLTENLKKTGRILILSSLDRDPEEIYTMYKSRNAVEKHFEAFKSLVQADKLYLRDDFAVMGHVFVGFLCLYLYCRILERIARAKMTQHLSVETLLLMLSKVYAIQFAESRIITEVPKKVREIAEALDIPIFPKECGD